MRQHQPCFQRWRRIPVSMCRWTPACRVSTAVMANAWEGPGTRGRLAPGTTGSYDPVLWDSSFVNLIVQDGHVPHDGKSGDDGDEPNTPLKTFSVRGREWRGLSAPVLPSPGTARITYDEDASIQELAKQWLASVWLQMMVEKARLISMTTDPSEVGGYADWVIWSTGL